MKMVNCRDQSQRGTVVAWLARSERGDGRTEEKTERKMKNEELSKEKIKEIKEREKRVIERITEPERWEK